MWKRISITTLVAGTLDIIAAFVHAYISHGVMPYSVLAYIASGIWGKAAFADGLDIIFFGLLFHFIIVFACVCVFFWSYSKWTFLQQSIVINAVLIALIAWFITTQIIIRISQITTVPFQFSNAFLAIGILIVCIGLPIAYSAKKSYTNFH